MGATSTARFAQASIQSITTSQAAPAQYPYAELNRAILQSNRSSFGAQAPAASASMFGAATSYGAPPAPAPQFAPSTPSPSLFSRKKKSTVTDATQPFAPALTSADRLDRLARLQAFDGSFATDVAILCGADLSKITAALALNLAKDQLDSLAATIVAMRFMETHLTDIEDAWEAIFEKAKDFCVGVLGGESELPAALGKLAGVVA